MAKVYSAPDEIKVPDFDFKKSRTENLQNEQAFIEELRNWIKRNYTKGKYVGEELDIPHADGYARYLVVSLKPATLIHMPLCDAWHAPQVDYMPSKVIKQTIDGRKEIDALFAKRREESN